MGSLTFLGVVEGWGVIGIKGDFELGGEREGDLVYRNGGGKMF